MFMVFCDKCIRQYYGGIYLYRLTRTRIKILEKEKKVLIYIWELL
jgi:hypothetical protein